jgi:PadR family transcriptional regulator, regulatory protein PadR
MAEKKSDLLQGTLDLLILKTIAAGPAHGYGIAQRILLLSRDVLDVQQGSLYPALHRLERKGLAQSAWKESDSGRMAKYYTLTAAGKRQLKAEMGEWQRYAAAIALVLEA